MFKLLCKTTKQNKKSSLPYTFVGGGPLPTSSRVFLELERRQKLG